MKSVENIGSGAVLVTDGKLKYVEFESLNNYRDILVHCMSTRAGGVSGGECATLNLGFNRNDSHENVLENFRIICGSTGINPGSLVLANQVHGTGVRIVGDADRGTGFPGKTGGMAGVDGLITAMPDVTLTTFHADCVPVFLFEPVAKTASLLHSGWRGTLGNIVSAAMEIMKRIPGFDAGRVIAAIGPSIGSCCFEVGADVYGLFAEKLGNNGYVKQEPGGKWKIDLKGIIRHELIDEGVPGKNIHDSGICTRCRKDLFFSYRGDAGRTGSLAAFMQIRR